MYVKKTLMSRKSTCLERMVGYCAQDGAGLGGTTAGPQRLWNVSVCSGSIVYIFCSTDCFPDSDSFDFFLHDRRRWLGGNERDIAEVLETGTRGD